ncbi:MAG: LysR substrate-binding domain-containing protein [Propionivibrio sp.]
MSNMKMPGKLPPLAPLRAFEAVARLGSVSAAADEMFVTHSAVSQQIKALEEALGVKLLSRAGRGIALTVAGRELAAGANEALCALAQTASQVRRRANPNRLTVTTLPSFAACWLTPRISRFLEEAPDAQINIVPTSNLLDYAREGIDVGIRFGLSGAVDGLDATLLMRDEMLVVASPAYLARHRIDKPADLAGCTLLRTEGDAWSRAGESWSSWFARVGLEGGEPEKGLFFFDFGLALAWAENGHGVALTRRSLADESLRSGRLVHILDVTLPDARSYWFATQQGIELTPLVRQFRDWTFKEARAMRLAAGA